MKRVSKFGGLAAAVLLSACTTLARGSTVQARLDEPFQLPKGEVATVALATEGAQPRYATYGAYDLHLVALEPPRRTDVPHPAYVATLRVVRR